MPPASLQALPWGGRGAGPGLGCRMVCRRRYGLGAINMAAIGRHAASAPDGTVPRTGAQAHGQETNHASSQPQHHRALAVPPTCSVPPDMEATARWHRPFNMSPVMLLCSTFGPRTPTGMSPDKESLAIRNRELGTPNRDQSATA